LSCQRINLKIFKFWKNIILIKITRTGNPNHEGGKEWPKYTAEKEESLELKFEMKTL